MSIIGIGTDIVEVSRIERALDESFLRRCFSDAENELLKKRKMNPQTAAANFAAKEAFVKALGTGFCGGIAPSEIETLRNQNGKPFINLHGKARSKSLELGVAEAHVSLAHTKEYAQAFVVLTGEGAPNT